MFLLIEIGIGLALGGMAVTAALAILLWTVSIIANVCSFLFGGKRRVHQ